MMPGADAFHEDTGSRPMRDRPLARPTQSVTCAAIRAAMPVAETLVLSMTTSFVMSETLVNRFDVPFPQRRPGDAGREGQGCEGEERTG